jgi:hypothetical protein
VERHALRPGGGADDTRKALSSKTLQSEAARRGPRRESPSEAGGVRSARPLRGAGDHRTVAPSAHRETPRRAASGSHRSRQARSLAAASWQAFRDADRDDELRPWISLHSPTVAARVENESSVSRSLTARAGVPDAATSTQSVRSMDQLVPYPCARTCDSSRPMEVGVVAAWPSSQVGDHGHGRSRDSAPTGRRDAHRRVPR